MYTLKEFLVDNGINDFEERLERDVEAFYSRCWIEEAFDWDKQPEGIEFWSDLNFKWVEICLKQEVEYGIHNSRYSFHSSNGVIN
jgi:hypothetical protein